MIDINPSRGMRLVGASALALGVATATVALAPTVGAVAPAAASAPTDDGVLDWGIKESFRSYVEGPIADGEITMVAPATRKDDGTFRFPGGTGDIDPEAGTASIALAGGVHFYGHDGSLDLWVEDLRVEVDGGSGVVVGTARDADSELVDVDLVSFELGGQTLQPDPDGVVTLTDLPTVLTTEGAPAFGDFYEPGAAMDPLTLTATVDDGSDPTETPTTSAPPTSQPPTSQPPTSQPPTSQPPTQTETPPPPPDPEPSATWEEGEVSSGRLDWGVKESFRTYIAGPIAHGEWTLTGITESDGRFHWTRSFGEYDMDDASGSVGFTGGVRFVGHDGSLDITISRPRVRFTGGDDAVLVVDVRSKSLQGEEVVEKTGVEFARLDLSAASSDVDDDSVSYASIPATLTAAGAEGFGGFYQDGTDLDPVTIAFGVGGAEVAGGGSAGGPGGLASTGPTPSTLPAAVTSAALLLLGGGLLVASRRLRRVPAQPTNSAKEL